MRKNTRWKRHITTRQNIRSFDKAKDTGFSPRRGKTGALPPLCGFPVQDAKKTRGAPHFAPEAAAAFSAWKLSVAEIFRKSDRQRTACAFAFLNGLPSYAGGAVPAGAGRFSFGFAAALRLRRSSRRQCFFRQSLIYCAKQLDLGFGNKL